MNAKTTVREPGLQTVPAQSTFRGRTVLRISEVARHLDVTNEHVLALIDAGLLPAINVGIRRRKCWRIPVENFQAFLEQRNL